MKPRTVDRKVVEKGMKDTVAAGLKMGAHLMDMLHGHYGDPRYAVIREYGTNMVDAYQKLPDDAEIIPPEIHLPTVFEPWITFKDYGVGMSFDTVWEVYTTYGDSTKWDNDDEAGFLGIGAKAAFGYEGADQWVVESRFDGEKMVFVAYMNEQNIPTFSHVETVDTDEPNGVTVKVPVADKDVDEFRSGVSKFLRYFPMPIKVTGDGDFEIKKPEYTLSGDGWGIRVDGPDRANAIMGPIAYPVSPYDAGVDPGDQMVLSNSKLDLYFDMGALDFIPSREGLKYTEHTKKAIQDALDGLMEDIQEKVEKKLEDCDTMWEAYCLASDVVSHRSLRNFVSRVQFKDAEVKPGSGITLDIRDLPDDTSITIYSYVSGRNSVSTETDISSVRVRRDTALVLDDMGRGSRKRIKHWLKHNDGEGRGPIRTAIVVEGDDVTKKLLQDAVGQAPVKLATEFPKVPKKKSSGYSTSTPIRRFSGYNFYNSNHDFDDGGVYIELYYGKPRDVTTHELKALWSWAEDLGIVDEDDMLYGIPASNVSRAEAHDEWDELFDLMEDKVNWFVSRYSADLNAYPLWTEVKGENNTLLKILTGLHTRSFPKGTVIRDLKDELNRWEDRINKIRKIESAASNLELEIPEDEPSWNPMDLLSEVLEQYPMLAVVNRVSGGYSYHVQNDAELIELVKSYIKENK